MYILLVPLFIIIPFVCTLYCSTAGISPYIFNELRLCVMDTGEVSQYLTIFLMHK